MTEPNPVQTSVQQPGALAREVHIQLSTDHVERVTAERLERLRRTLRMNGFRPGHAPLREVARRHGPQVRGEVVGDLLQGAVAQALREHSLRPASTPQLEPAVPAEGAEQPTDVLRFVARFEVFPEVQLADWSTLRIAVPTAEVTDADVDQALERLRKQRAEWKAVDRAAAEGDRVVADFTGTLDGEAFEGGSATGAPLVVGGGSLLPDFEAALPGLSAGEERSFTVNFPAGYPRAELAGRAAQFQLKCSAVEEAELPEVNDALAQALGVEGGVEALRERVRETLLAEVARVSGQRRKNAVMDLLAEQHQFDLPASLVHAEAHQLAHRQGATAHAGHDHDNPDHEAEVAKLEPQAARRVKLGLVLAEVARAAKLQADPERVRAEVEALGRRFEDPEQVTRWYYADPQRLQDIQNSVLEEQLVEWVAAQVQVDTQPVALDDLIGRPG